MAELKPCGMMGRMALGDVSESLWMCTRHFLEESIGCCMVQCACTATLKGLFDRISRGLNLFEVNVFAFVLLEDFSAALLS